jgi:hypothetical protein
MNTKFPINQTSQTSIQELEHALKIAAKVVAMYGEVYLPIFSRLQNELVKAKEADKMKTLALELALSYCEGG